MPKIPAQRRRVLIYVRGTADEVDRQLAGVTETCNRRGYDIAGIIREQPGATDRWHEANAMVRAGDADQLLVASANNVPDTLESATGAIPGPPQRPSPGAHRAGRRRRIRPLRRGGGA